MSSECPQCGRRYKGLVDRCQDDDARLVELPDPLLGRVLSDRYRLDERIGIGGMGTVYRARHVPLLRDVAIKILDEELAKEPLLVKRFLREARAANLLRHENVINIYD